MPLLRTRARVHGAKGRFGIAFYMALVGLTVVLAGVLIGGHRLGWW